MAEEREPELTTLLLEAKPRSRGRMAIAEAVTYVRGKQEEPTPQFVEVIRHSGVLEDVIFTEDEDGTRRLVAGVRRIKAADRTGKKDVPYAVYSAESVAAVVPGQKRYGRELAEAALTLSLNYHQTHNALAELRAFERLAKVIPEKEIAQQLHIPLGKVRRRLKLLRLLPGLRAAWEQGKIRTSLAEQIASRSPDLQQRLLQRLTGSGDDRLHPTDLREERQVAQTRTVGALPQALFGELEPEDAQGKKVTQALGLLIAATTLLVEAGQDVTGLVAYRNQLNGNG